MHPKSESCSTSLTRIITPSYKLRSGLICIWHRQSYKFQPVQNANDFETQLRNDNVAFVIVASAYLAETQTQLTPLLVPANNEDVYYRKVLVAKTGTTAEGLTGKNIAAALVALTETPLSALLKPNSRTPPTP